MNFLVESFLVSISSKTLQSLFFFFLVRDTDDSEIASSAPSTTTFTNFESRISRK